MDIVKLKLDKFSNINVMNFPQEVEVGIESKDKDVEVVLYYIDNINDINNFVNYVNKTNLSKDNRTIMVYKKGRKDVNRDVIITPFKVGEIKGFKMKAPMLCSLSKDYSAFVMMKE
ncbi:hypothetical protein RJG79_03590 [Mycoplasmatota bacterium WC44]